MILTLVGVSHGMLGRYCRRVLAARAPTSWSARPAVPSSGSPANMPEKMVAIRRKQPHVAHRHRNVLQQNVGTFDSIMREFNLDEFNEMSGGFQYISGGPFTGADMISSSMKFMRDRNT